MATKRTAITTLTGSLTDIYEVPTHKLAEVQLIYVTNTSGSTGSYTVTYYDNSTTTSIHFLNGSTIASKENFKFGGPFNEILILEEGDKIQASGTQSGSIFVTVLEHNTNR
jgi:hypothetical protein